MLYRICFTYLKNVSDTEDCVQDTFVQLIRKEPYFDNDDHEKAWLIRVASNICKNKLKHWWFSKKNNSQDDQLMGSHQLDVNETLMAIMTPYLKSIRSLSIFITTSVIIVSNYQKCLTNRHQLSVTIFIKHASYFGKN